MRFIWRCHSGKGAHIALRGEFPGRSQVVAVKSGFPLSYDGDFRDPAYVASGMSSLHASCEGPLQIPLPSVPDPRTSFGAEATNSGFPSRADRDLGVPMEFEQGSQASSFVETCKSTFLPICISRDRLPVELT